METKLVYLMVLLTGLFAKAQHVEREIFANAGEPSSNGSFMLNFTLGEPIVGPISNENSVLDQGFWAGHLFLETTLEEESNTDLILFPIPVTDVLHIVPGNNQVFGLKVFSLTGRQIMSRIVETSGPEILVDMTALANAAYIVNVFVQGESKSRMFKIIKQ